MKLFIKKQKNGEKPKRKRKKEFKLPTDVKIFYYMPISVLIATIMIIGGVGKAIYNTHVYHEKVMASSMAYGTQLPLWGGDSSGTLTLGHTKLSADGKTLAAEINYDEAAHSSLSSFGNRYGLRLVDTKDNIMHVSIKYGLFGSDGSGVLTIHSNTGFRNKAFVVMIIDKGGLITSDELDNGGEVMSDEDIDKSITAQLSNAEESSSSASNESEKTHMPPLYYVRLNAKSAKRSKYNWKNERDIVNDLFVRSNLRALHKQQKGIEKRYERGKKTLKEMKARLQENPNDETAKQNIDSLTTSLQSLSDQVDGIKKNVNKIENSTIKKNVLDPRQSKYETFVENDLSQLEGNNSE